MSRPKAVTLLSQMWLRWRGPAAKLFFTGERGRTYGGTGQAVQGVARYRDHYRVRVDYGGQTHALGNVRHSTDARAALDITRGQIARSLFVPPAERGAEAAKAAAQSVTLSQWSETWLADLEAAPDRSRATVVSYRSVLRTATTSIPLRGVLEQLAARGPDVQVVRGAAPAPVPAGPRRTRTPSASPVSTGPSAITRMPRAPHFEEVPHSAGCRVIAPLNAQTG